MAFFGLTQLGPQEPLKDANINNIDLNIFEDDEFLDAFDNYDRDGSGFIEKGELAALLHDVFHGPPTGDYLQQFLNKFDANGDGKLSRDELKQGVSELKKDSEDRQNSLKPTVTSGEQYRAQLKKHTRGASCAADRGEISTTTQLYGRTPEGYVPLPNENARTKKSCPETQYADAMVKSGVYF